MTVSGNQGLWSLSSRLRYNFGARGCRHSINLAISGLALWRLHYFGRKAVRRGAYVLVRGLRSRRHRRHYEANFKGLSLLLIIETFSNTSERNRRETKWLRASGTRRCGWGPSGAWPSIDRWLTVVLFWFPHFLFRFLLSWNVSEIYPVHLCSPSQSGKGPANPTDVDNELLCHARTHAWKDTKGVSQQTCCNSMNAIGTRNWASYSKWPKKVFRILIYRSCQTWLKIIFSDLDHQIKSLLIKWSDLEIFTH